MAKITVKERAKIFAYLFIKGQEGLRAQNFRFAGLWARFQSEDKVKVLPTPAVHNRHPETKGLKGIVLFSYYTTNNCYRNYFVRVLLDNNFMYSYFTADLMKIK